MHLRTVPERLPKGRRRNLLELPQTKEAVQFLDGFSHISIHLELFGFEAQLGHLVDTANIFEKDVGVVGAAAAHEGTGGIVGGA